MRTPGFTVSTNPGSGPGRKTGSRDTTEFHITLKAVADAGFENPPATIRFQLYRARTNATVWMSADRIVGSNPARYELDWSVRTDQGKWEIKVESYPCNTVTFKIDKRKQIVEVANSWANVALSPTEAESVNLCNEFVARVYGRLGLPIAATVDPQYAGATIPCSGNGCLLFFNIMEGPGGGPYTPRSPWNPQHVAIRDGGQRINADSLTQPRNFVVEKEAPDAGVATNPPWYDPNIHERSTVNLDED